MDRLSALLMRFGYTVETFYRGSFCGGNLLPATAGVGYLHLVKSGQVSFHHEDRPTMVVNTPSLVLYPRPCEHRLEARDNVELVCATILAHGAPDDLVKTLPQLITLPFVEMPELAATLELVFAEASRDGFGQQLLLDRLCDVLLVQLLRHLLTRKIVSEQDLFGLTDSTLSKAMLAMQAEPGKPWTVESLAALCGMSRSKFAQRFHVVIGATPADYLLEQRMNLAKRLLLHGRQVQDVASDVGYSTQPAFTRAFRAACHMTPREWLTRQSIRAGGASTPPSPSGQRPASHIRKVPEPGWLA